MREFKNPNNEGNKNLEYLQGYLLKAKAQEEEDEDNFENSKLDIEEERKSNDGSKQNSQGNSKNQKGDSQDGVFEEIKLEPSVINSDDLFA